jgi:protein phosphatase
VDSGQITKAEAVNHPQKNEITNCIGLQGMAEPETVAVPIMPEPGSVFLLCSDGLSSMVDEARIERVISSSDMSLQQKADRLIEMANNAGGLDNITIELVQFSTSNNVGATSGTLFDTAVDTRAKKSPMKALLYGLIGAVVVAGLGFGAYKLLDKKPKPEPPVKTEAPKPDVPSGDQNVNVSTNTGGQSTTPAPSTAVSTKSTSTTGSSTGTSVSSSSSSKANAKTAIKNESKTNSNNAKKNQIKNAADGKTDEKTNQKQKVVIDEAKKGQTPPAGDLPEGTLREKD